MPQVIKNNDKEKKPTQHTLKS